MHTERGRIVDGVLTCVQCLKKSVVIRQQRTVPVRLAIGAGVALVLIGVLSPSLLLLGLVLASSSAMVLGLAGFTLSGATRTALIGIGTIVLCVAVAGLMRMNALKESRRVNSALSADAGKIQQLIKDGHGMEAQQRLTAFKHAAMSNTGEYASPEAAALAQSLTQDLDTWFTQTYGVSKQSERELLQRLIMTFGENTPAGSRRFTAVKIDEGRVQVTATLPTEARNLEGANRDPAMEEATRLARLISDLQAAAKEIEVILLADNAPHEEVSKMTYTQELLHRIKLGGASLPSRLDATGASTPSTPMRTDVNAPKPSTQTPLPPNMPKMDR